jgi:uncharacterized protein DUF4267
MAFGRPRRHLSFSNVTLFCVTHRGRLTLNATSTPSTWKLTSPTAVLSWALVVFLLFLSALAALDPVGAADGFGLPMTGLDAVPWLRIKAGRDLGIALMLAVVLLQRQRRLVGAVTLASVAMPVVDALTVISHGARSVGYALGVHGSALLYCLLLGMALLRPAKA